MTGGGGKDLATQGLGLIAKGLTEALGELRELGMVGEAGAGRGFSDIALSGLELGHEGLTDEFTSFCERWEWGVRSLINEGNGFAARTGLAAGTYYETDQYVEGTFKIVTNAAVGNPYASEEDVQKMVDDVSGPSPEARVHAAERGGPAHPGRHSGRHRVALPVRPSRRGHRQAAHRRERYRCISTPRTTSTLPTSTISSF